MPCSQSDRRVRSSASLRIASMGSGIGASSHSRTSFLEMRAASAWAIRLSRRLEGFMPGAASSTASRLPYWFISSAAPLGPMPGTPGTLSTLSPIRDCTSITSSGGTPNFSITSAGPIGFCLIGSSIVTPGRTSCIRSLSELTMVTVAPASSPALA